MDLSRSKKLFDNRRSVLGDDVVDFFLGLWEKQEEVAPFPWDPKNLEDLTEAATKGLPMFFVDSPAISSDYFLKTLLPLLDYIAKHPAANSDIFAKAMKEDTLKVEDEDLKTAFTDPNSLVQNICKQLDVPADDSESSALLELAVLSALQPTAFAAAEKLTPPEQGSFETGICPCCGTPAAVGVITDTGLLNGGARELWCSFCDTTWDYARIRCTRCGNTAQKELRYFFDEEDPGHRIYGCQKCGGLQKVVDTKMVKQIVDARVEDFIMIPLYANVAEQADKLFDGEETAE